MALQKVFYLDVSMLFLGKFWVGMEPGIKLFLDASENYQNEILKSSLNKEIHFKFWVA